MALWLAFSSFDAAVKLSSKTATTTCSSVHPT
eukprot:CAMPEP_0173461318 /NCGR_PEP_ID=MMETSP1357-20121228/64747_1 /TAXON_ID=77926 /ORGANISM="Hemiselmis rufescens, Strain PCC563" /LENGTH=31 /DNA_ID= /DNA_START= /DNA_END= /DNA_ORIENTATION=